MNTSLNTCYSIETLGIASLIRCHPLDQEYETGKVQMALEQMLEEVGTSITWFKKPMLHS